MPLAQRHIEKLLTRVRRRRHGWPEWMRRSLQACCIRRRCSRTRRKRGGCCGTRPSIVDVPPQPQGAAGDPEARRGRGGGGSLVWRCGRGRRGRSGRGGNGTPKRTQKIGNRCDQGVETQKKRSKAGRRTRAERSPAPRPRLRPPATGPSPAPGPTRSRKRRARIELRKPSTETNPEDGGKS